MLDAVNLFKPFLYLLRVHSQRITEGKTGSPRCSLEGMDDHKLMLKYSKTGNVAAFEILMKRYQHQIFGYLMQSCRNKDLAEDIYQETFFRVIKSAGKYKTNASFRTWIFKIARNLLIDEHRKKISRPSEITAFNEETGKDFLFESASKSPDAEKEMQAREIREALAKALAELPAEQREMFLLRESGGLNFKEAAHIADCSLNTAKSRMRYAVLKIRKSLEVDGLIPEKDL